VEKSSAAIELHGACLFGLRKNRWCERVRCSGTCKWGCAEILVYVLITSLIEAAQIAFSIFPVIIVYLFLSRYIVQGIALGSVKG